MSFREKWIEMWNFWKIQKEKEEENHAAKKLKDLYEEESEPKAQLPREVAEFFLDFPLELGCFPCRAVSYKRMIQIYQAFDEATQIIKEYQNNSGCGIGRCETWIEKYGVPTNV